MLSLKWPFLYNREPHFLQIILNMLILNIPIYKFLSIIPICNIDKISLWLEKNEVHLWQK